MSQRDTEAMTETQIKAAKIITELEAEFTNNIFKEIAVKSKVVADAAHLARIGAFQLAILKIKFAFDLTL